MAMAKLLVMHRHNNLQPILSILLIAVISVLSGWPSSSSATSRLSLNGYEYLPASEPALNLALPGDGIVFSQVMANPSSDQPSSSSERETDSKKVVHHVLPLQPCDTSAMEMESKNMMIDNVLVPSDDLVKVVPAARPDITAAGKYGPLVLNLLPKGPAPPSGPSTGSNSISDETNPN